MWIRASGKGANEASSDKQYLYKDGTQIVEWDNKGYDLDSYYTTSGGLSLNSTNIGLPILTYTTARSIVTNESINLANYNTLYIERDGAIHSWDISSLSGYYYITVGENYDSGTTFFDVYISTQKYRCATYKVAGNINVTNHSSGTWYVTKVWLQK